MLIKYWIYIKNLNKLASVLAVIFFVSCSTEKKITFESENDETRFMEGSNAPIPDSDKRSTNCTKDGKLEHYIVGDLPCVRNILEVSESEFLKIFFKITDKDSEDLYEHGYQELIRYKNGKIIETMKLRKDEDAYWSEVPFVRIRKQKYLVDLDGDGYLEFAFYPFSPGSAIWGRVRIFSLKDKIEFWGYGKYQFEGDTFVQLGCLDCSKFKPEACKKCH